MASSKTIVKVLSVMLAVLILASTAACIGAAVSNDANEAYASEETEGAETSAAADPTGDKALAAAIAIGLAAAGGAVAMGIAIAKASESIARQPEAKNDIRTTLMLGLVFIETAIIYALIVSILVVFVL